MSMSIYTQKGAKIVFSHPNAGSTYDHKMTAEHLKVDDVYTVEGTRVGGGHTTVRLEEVSGVVFNSVNFDNA